jgi:Arc/MetJ-type ribon-helix-helix transcriptional regulator
MNQTINISLPIDLVKLAKDQIKLGYYTSISEVVRDALRHSLLQPQKINNSKYVK